jgi:small subunit ribosomal protein S17
MTTTPETRPQNKRRTLQGKVTSDKMEKSITVLVERTFKHAKYGKFVRRHKKYLAHDEDGVAKLGDVVEIVSTRPMSKRKRWRLLRVLGAGRIEEGAVPGSDAVDQLTATPLEQTIHEGEDEQ